MPIRFTAVTRSAASVISSGGFAIPRNRIPVSAAAWLFFRSKNTSRAVTFAPLNPTTRSSSEKCESAFASVTDSRGIPSTPCSEDVSISNRLCRSTRASYTASPRSTLCVLQRSTDPSPNSQSTSSSGVSGVTCSFNSKTFAMEHPQFAVVSSRSRGRHHQPVVRQARVPVDSAA